MSVTARTMSSASSARGAPMLTSSSIAPPGDLLRDVDLDAGQVAVAELPLELRPARWG